MSHRIAPKQVEELPLNLRNVIGLVLLNSSVNNQTQQQVLAAGGSQRIRPTRTCHPSVLAAAFFGTTAFLLDGAGTSRRLGGSSIPAVTTPRNSK